MTEQSNAAKKKDIMWNIIDPGDPYDIRKSMIATLPGQRKFMGPHLELVCLLQAAQIERLCLFLEQHKVKLRESQRLELDRHSYEVQIKELTEKLSGFQANKLQNQRLKEHIRRQTIELEQLQKQLSQNNMDLSKKYENSLRQVQLLLKQKDQINSIKGKLQNQLINIKQLYKINQQAKSKQFQALTKQIERLNEQKLEQDQRYRENYKKWDIQRKKSETEFGYLSKRYQQLQQRFRQADNLNQNLKKQLERTKYQAAKAEQYRKTFKQYQDRFVKVAQQIDRLNEVLKEKSRLLNEQNLRTKQLNEINRKLQNENSEKEQKVRELQRGNSVLLRQQRQALASLNSLEQNKLIIKSYQASLQKYGVEVERLSGIIIKKNAENEELKNKNAEYQANIRNLERNNTRLSQEADRVRQSLKNILQERNSLQFKNQGYQSQFKKLQNTITSLSSQVEKQRYSKQSQPQGTNTAQVERLKNLISREKQQNLQNEEKIAYLQRQIKNLEEKLLSKEDPSKYFRHIYDSSEQLKANIDSQEKREDYIKDLKKRIKMLELQMKYAKQQPILSNELGQQIKMPQEKQPQVFKTPQEQIQKLKDDLLSKEIQNHRLVQINQQLREMVHDYKKRIVSSPYQSASPTPVGLGYGSKSPEDDRQYTKMQEQGLRPKQWEIQQEQQISINQQEQPRFQYPAERPRPQYSTRQKDIGERPISRGRETNRPFDRSQPRQTQKGEQKNPDLSRNYYQKREDSEGAQRQIQTIQDPSVFKKALEQIQQIKQPSDLAANYKNMYQKLIGQYQKLTRSHNKLKSKLRNEKQANQLSENYINELTGKIEVLNDQICQLKQRIDPKFYVQNQEGTLQKSYSLLLQKYNNAVFDNDNLRSKIKNINQATSKITPEQSNEGEIRRLYEQNESLKKNCSTFSQYYTKIKMTNDQLERLKKILIEKDKELELRQRQIRDYQIQQLNYQNQIKQINSKYRDLPGYSQVTLPLTQQVGSNVLQRDRQILRLQNRNAELERIVKEYELGQPISISGPQQQKRKIQNKLQAMSMQITRLNNLLVNKKKDIEVLEQKNKSLSRVVEDNKRMTSSNVDNRNILFVYEDKITMLGHQLQRLNSLLAYKNQLYDQLKKQFDEYSQETKRQLENYAAEIQKLNNQVSSLKGDVDRTKNKGNNQPYQTQNLTQYQAKLIQLSNQINRLNRLLIANKEKIDDYQDKISKYRSQIQRLNNSLRLKVEESIMSAGLERSHAQQKRILNRQIQDKTKELEDLIQKNKVIEEENSKFNQHLDQYEIRIKGLYQELERLQRIISILKKENPDIDAESLSQLFQKNRFLLGEIERLNAINANQTQDLSDLRLNLSDQASMQKRMKEDLALFVVLFAQIESLRNRVRDQEIQLEQVRRVSVLTRKA